MKCFLITENMFQMIGMWSHCLFPTLFSHCSWFGICSCCFQGFYSIYGLFSLALINLDKYESMNVGFYYISFKMLSSELVMYNFLKKVIILSLD